MNMQNTVTNGKDSAFGYVEPHNGADVYTGLSKREYFAIQALTGLLSTNEGITAELVSEAIYAADKLILGLNKTN